MLQKRCAYWTGRTKHITLKGAADAAATKEGWSHRLERFVKLLTPEGNDEEPDTNVWLSQGPTVAGLHYDQNHNFLTQLTGRKRVELLTHTGTHTTGAKLHPYNHPSWRQAQLDTTAGLPDVPAAVVLSPGDSLYIAPFMLHRVVSLDGTSISVNTWFRSRASAVEEAGRDLSLPLRPDAAPGELDCAVRFYAQRFLTHLSNSITASIKTSSVGTTSTSERERERFQPKAFIDSLYTERFGLLLRGASGNPQSCRSCRNFQVSESELEASAVRNAAHFGESGLSLGILGTMAGDHVESVVGFAVEVGGHEGGAVAGLWQLQASSCGAPGAKINCRPCRPTSARARGVGCTGGQVPFRCASSPRAKRATLVLSAVTVLIIMRHPAD